MTLQRISRSLTLTAALAFAAMPFASIPVSSFAQGITTGSLSGTVVDPSGAAISGASITVLNGATGVKQSAQSNNQGYFSIRSLQVGTYQVVVESSNFVKKTTDGVSVTAGQSNDLGPVQLTVGSSATQVEVNASSTPLLHTEDSQVQSTFSSLQMQDQRLRVLHRLISGFLCERL